MVHLVTHFDLASDSILMAKQESSTGNLSMDEAQTQLELFFIYGALVNLSSCNSGRRNIRREGVVGMCLAPSSFNSAGAVESTVSKVYYSSTEAFNCA